MKNFIADKLGALILVALVIFLAASLLAFLPAFAELTLAQVRLVTIGIAGAVLALGGWAIWRTHRRLSRLVRTARAAEQGDYSVRSHDSGADLIGQLSVAIDGMARHTGAVLADFDDRSREVLRLSTHDHLTGLPNRRLFHELLIKEFAHARRDKQKPGVILMDLDGFKDFNDSLGHEAGDEILRQVASRLLGITRDADTLARIGGDEFALLLTGIEDRRELIEAINRIWPVFEKPFKVGDAAIRVAASAGISIFRDHAESPELLLGQSELAVRWIKQQGGKRWAVFEPSMDLQARHRLELEQDFHRALQDDQLLVHYQPICAVEDGTLLGLEALVRWQHPESGLLNAAKFIPTLERAGLMPELGSWLFTEICRQAATWRQAGLPPLPISVNVSIRQFQAGDVAEVAAQAMATSGLPTDSLQLEITESIALHDVGQMILSLQRCQELGVKIHLDDFGTGYSSLSYLLKLPVDVLKIDQTFIAGVPDSPHSVAIVKATLALAKGLGLRAIAEGVETPEQLRFLRDIGCEAAQGYLLGRPVSVTEIEALLAAEQVTLPTPVPA